MQFYLSHCRPRFWFRLRSRFALLWCHGCGRRYQRTGVLSLIDNRLLQWACIGCYARAYARAAS